MPARHGTAGTSLRDVGLTCIWLLAIAATVVAALWLAARLRLVVLPVILALVLATLLWPLAAALRRRGWPDALAALTAVVGLIGVISGLVVVVAPGAVEDFQELDVSLIGGVDEIQGWLKSGPFSLSDQQIEDAIDRAQSAFSDSFGTIADQALGGAFLFIEVVTGLVLAMVVLFFLLKDGEAIWRWVLGLFPARRRESVNGTATESWAALGGFLRGQTIVALFDTALIALALVLIGVPLVLPLAMLTFFGAYVPIIGATASGAAAALVALFAGGPLDAALVVVAILVVQQVEGNVLQPYAVGRSVHVHPVAILLGVTAGGVLAGIIGIMIAAPAVAVAGAILRTVREDDATAPEP